MASVDLSINATAFLADDRDISRYSDHVLVLVDAHIGEPDANPQLRERFDSHVQVLRSNNPDEDELDDPSMLFIRSDLLASLRNEVYCLNYFSTSDAGLKYIHAHPDKKIFFISSGTIGRIMVPEIVALPQIKAIYIFCGNIAFHLEWALDYQYQAFLMFDHEDDLLARLTLDLGQYVESKGDRYEAHKDFFQARNCFIWAKKLYLRCASVSDINTTAKVRTITEKIDRMELSHEVSS